MIARASVARPEISRDDSNYRKNRQVRARKIFTENERDPVNEQVVVERNVMGMYGFLSACPAARAIAFS